MGSKLVRRLVPRGRLLLRERANLSFLIVVVFFAVFSVIVLTEIFLIEERSSRTDVSSSSHRITPRKYVDYDAGQVLAQGGETEYIVYQPNSVVSALLHPRTMMHSNSVKSVMAAQPAAAVLSPEKGAEERLPGVGNTTAQDGVWQSVGGTRFKFFVFSAYYDFRQARIVRVIGATKTRGSERVWCRLWYHNTTDPGFVNHSISVPARIKVIRENWNLKYSACFVLCPLKGKRSVPTSVSIVSRLRLYPNNRLIVHQPQLNGTVRPPWKMAACIKPLHFNYNQSLPMVEFIELNYLLGVEHIYFYNDSVSPSTSCVLDAYAAEGRVTVLPWRLDMASQREIRTEGLFAAFNDCLYRSMYTYSHIALIDLDEFIMPQHNETLLQLIEWLSKRTNTREVASYSFQNAFFYLQWSDDATLTVSDPFQSNLVTLRKTRRRVKLHPHKQRSKYICRPEYVVEAGNHFVWEFIPGHGTLNVLSDAAILNHYRVCEFGGDDCTRSASVVDRTAFRYRDRLVGTVRERWNSIKSECNLPEVTIKPLTLSTTSTNDTVAIS